MLLCILFINLNYIVQGSMQSPINLPDKDDAIYNHNFEFEIDYSPIVNISLEYTLPQLLVRSFAIKRVIQMNLDTATTPGSLVFHDLDQSHRMYKLKNFSFHSPSEHTLNGV